MLVHTKKVLAPTQLFSGGPNVCKAHIQVEGRVSDEGVDAIAGVEEQVFGLLQLECGGGEGLFSGGLRCVGIQERS